MGEERKPLQAGLVFRLRVRRSRGSHRTSESEPRLGYSRPYLREQSKNISQPSKLNPKPKLPGKQSMNKDKQYFSNKNTWLGTRRQNQEPKATHLSSATQQSQPGQHRPCLQKTKPLMCTFISKISSWRFPYRQPRTTETLLPSQWTCPLARDLPPSQGHPSLSSDPSPRN